MNNKIFNVLGYLIIFIIAVLIRILYPYETFENIIVDIMLFGGGIFIYRKQRCTYSARFILYFLLLTVIIYAGSLWLGFFFRLLFIDDGIMAGIMYTIIDLIKVICLVLIYSKLCENIKFRNIKKHVILSILLCFIITIVPLIRITFVNEFLVVKSMVELEVWIQLLKQTSIIIQDFMKCIMMILLSKGLKTKCINDAQNP